MSTLIVENISDGTDTTTTTKIVLGNTLAYCSFSLSGGVPSVFDGSYNIASVTDAGVGEPRLGLTSYLFGVYDGASFVSPALNSAGTIIAAQAGSNILSTSQVACYCAGDNNTRQDWVRGTFTLVGKSV